MDSKDFLDKLAHDICTPLTVIGSFLSYISSQIHDEDAQAFYEAAYLSLGKAKRLVDSLKAHASSNGVSKTSPNIISKSPSDVVELIQRVIVELKPMARDKGVKLGLTSIDHLLGLVDPLALERVVTNLVKNAIEAIDKVEGHVRVQLVQYGRTISIYVRDNQAVSQLG